MTAKYYTLDCVYYPKLTGCYNWFRSTTADSPLTTLFCSHRRLKSEVLDQLPSKRRQMVCPFVELIFKLLCGKSTMHALFVHESR